MEVGEEGVGSEKWESITRSDEAWKLVVLEFKVQEFEVLEFLGFFFGWTLWLVEVGLGST